MNFYCRSYCLLNMFRAPLCPSSGGREYYKSGFCLSYLVLSFQVVGLVLSWGLCVRFAGHCLIYFRSYCLLNMFQAPLCPSSGGREYYTSGFCLSYLVLSFQVVGEVSSWGLCVRFAGHCLDLLMMDIMVPETCWASNKICNKNSSVASSWHFISTCHS
jgi:hypothetical protein